ncbi:MAG: Pyridoxamine 5'-phosphate oxidase [uncultured Nocardioidaceae bacterium]|uniref:Pyridoxine/pyridoxamine 5'-phosphate oxidase n=1 Tax=uncultured Nocardioidaceae bacterium TaxID=253824 RepID=A0A6J4N753_9ACTN|nr:MAG: Pyridoxamine 5'-phosphate oxidase [uncultured Nocardioidaceae bacterium]
MQPNQPVTLASLREEYTLGGLDEADLEPDPFAMLQRWLDEAIRAGLYDPTGMVVSTVSATGRPSSRMVLLKGLSVEGLVFFTNYSSRKGEELAGQGACSVVFPWHPLQRQVRAEGVATRIGDDENDAYFATRPRASQLGAWASPQSKVVESRDKLDARYAEAVARFGDGPVERPPYWGGFRIAPDTFEFWQGRRGRLHDRFRYRFSPTAARTDGQAWRIERLAP